MRVLIVHNRYLVQGGEDAVVESESDLLKQHGHDVVFYHRSNAELSGLNQMMVHRLLWSKKTYQELTRLMDDVRPDIAHFHNPFFMMTPSAYQACRDRRVPIVQTLHNYRFLCVNGVLFRNGKTCENCLTRGPHAAVINRCMHDSFFKSLVSWRLSRSYHKYKILDKLINGFIAPSRFCKEMYCRCAGIGEDKVDVKPHFITDPGVSSGRGRYALYAGALRDYKGIHVLLEAWKNIRDLPLKIIGKDVFGLARMCEGDVEFLGEKSPAEALNAVKQCACVIVPSLCYETFARVIIEAYACGRPVVASCIGAVTERVHDGRTGFLFEAGNSRELAEKVSRFIRSPDLQRSMGLDARRVYEERYTSEKNYPQLIKVYEKALDKNRMSSYNK